MAKNLAQVTGGAYSMLLVVCMLPLQAFAQSPLFDMRIRDISTARTKVAPLPGGDFILAGNSAGADGGFFLCLTDPQGDIRWMQVYDAPDTDGWEEVACVTQTSDGGFLLCGSSYGDGSYAAHLIKAAPDGDLQWVRRLSVAGKDTYGETVIEVVGGDQTSEYLLIGRTEDSATTAFALQLWPDLEVGWVREYRLAQNHESTLIRSIFELESGDYLIAGSYEEAESPAGSFLQQIEPDGRLSQTIARRYAVRAPWSLLKLVDARKTPDEGFAFVAVIGIPDSCFGEVCGPETSDTAFVKLGPTGEVENARAIYEPSHPNRYVPKNIIPVPGPLGTEYVISTIKARWPPLPPPLSYGPTLIGLSDNLTPQWSSMYAPSLVFHDLQLAPDHRVVVAGALRPPEVRPGVLLATLNRFLDAPCGLWSRISVSPKDENLEITLPPVALEAPRSAVVVSAPDTRVIPVNPDQSFPCTRFVRGDADASGFIDISDVIFINTYLFLSGEQPPCLDAADVNDTGMIDLPDAVYLVFWLFGGEFPPPPSPNGPVYSLASCGYEPPGDWGDPLDCDSFPPCQ